MNPSNQQLAIIDRYGGSDNTQLNFNFQRYVRYGSVHTPRDFGPVQNIYLDLEGVVGAESGTQTLFFRFELTEPSRVGLRRVRLNPYTDQYVSLALANFDGTVLPVGLDGFVTSGDVSSQTSVRTRLIEIGYALCGYWNTGYAEYDCVQIEESDQILSFDVDPADPFESIFGDYLEPGPYRFTISSSQWPQLPYRVQLAVIGEPRLVGEATSETRPETRLAAGFLDGNVTMNLELSGRLIDDINMEGEAAMNAEPRFTLDRQSPFS